MDERSHAMKAVDALVKERVQKGILFLREEYGEDWVEHIDLRALSLDDGASCVLGQVHLVMMGGEGWGGYADAVEHFGWMEDCSTPREYAFIDDPLRSISFKTLDAAWQEAIPKEQIRLQRLKAAGKANG
jgi:hypothetical protein